MWQDSTMSMGSMMGCGMMMGFLMPRVTNTPDGGVIVVTGNKLQKYDKDFNLRKEITVKIDTTGMQNLLRQSCPRLSDNQMQQPSSQGGSQQESAPQGAQQKSSMQQKQKKK